MHRSSENSDKNDIVTELGIQGVGLWRAGRVGRAFLQRAGLLTGMGDNFAATPMKAWDTIIEGATS